VQRKGHGCQHGETERGQQEQPPVGHEGEHAGDHGQRREQRGASEGAAVHGADSAAPARRGRVARHGLRCRSQGHAGFAGVAARPSRLGR
jgi:hypothetical protein